MARADWEVQDRGSRTRFNSDCPESYRVHRARTKKTEEFGSGWASSESKLRGKIGAEHDLDEFTLSYLFLMISVI